MTSPLPALFGLDRWHDDDQAGQQVGYMCALTLTRQIWLICARRDAKA